MKNIKLIMNSLMVHYDHSEVVFESSDTTLDKLESVYETLEQVKLDDPNKFHQLH